MTPAARVQAAIEILDAWCAADTGLDRILANWARAHRFAGSGDRRAIADLVYDAIRRRRSAAWVASTPEDDAAGLARGSLMLAHANLADFFDGSRYGPATLTDAERIARALDDAPRPVCLDYPDWLANDLAEISDAALEALRTRAPVDLRVNALKATPDTAISALLTDGIEVVKVPRVETALRVQDGARRVSQSQAYVDGLVEIQDAASQAVAAFAGAEPGMTVLDLCAGGGGKTLALAAAMQGEGRIIAHDIAEKRMQDLPARAARAGVNVEVLASDALSDWHGAFDLVVVDAPCSGSGAWRRNPDHKWRLTETGLIEVEAVQAALLDQAVNLCAQNGRIAYMTCSILACENQRQMTGFLTRHPAWRGDGELALSPADDVDGFYAARFSRNDC